MTELEIKLHTALKAMHEAADDLHWPQHALMTKAFVQANDVLHDVEMGLGPLPDWASAHNLGREAVQYAQLCTRDGERTGNAIIANVPSETSHTYYVITDMGNPMRLSVRELNDMFSIGPYIMDEAAVLKRKRQNPEMFGEELSLWDQAKADGRVEM